MRPALARQILHTLHAAASLALVATGALIELPELRSRTFGGYGLEIVATHQWATIVFVCGPLLVALFSAHSLLAEVRFRVRGPGGPSFRKLHLLASLLVSAFLTLTGVLLWLPDLEPRFSDPLIVAHVWVGWLFAAVIPVHVLAARRRIALRIRLWMRRATGLRRGPSGDEVPNDRV
ncbi:MAG: hypothetical protein ACE5IL_04735 [Myxococcota bacterium]